MNYLMSPGSSSVLWYCKAEGLSFLTFWDRVVCMEEILVDVVFLVRVGGSYV